MALGPSTEGESSKQPPARDPAEPSSWLYIHVRNAGTVETGANHMHADHPEPQISISQL